MGLGIKTYPEETLGIDRVLDYTYWNNNGVGIAIVAREGRANDWGAYIGAYSHIMWINMSHTEKEVVAYVCTDGVKLTKVIAHRWFPNLPIERYRE